MNQDGKTELASPKECQCSIPRPLPNKPSELIRLAIKDLEWAENNPEYKVVMSDWHFAGDEYCYVCLAGAVMANSLKVPIDKDYYPRDWEAATCDKLRAINAFRTGQLQEGLRLLGLNFSYYEVKDRYVPHYHQRYYTFADRLRIMLGLLKTFKPAMLSIAQYFEAKGI